MNIFKFFETEFKVIFDDLKAVGTIPESADGSKIVFELPRDASHGDIACNAAMVLAKQVGMKPRDLATLLAERLAACDGVTAVDIAGPGFINISVEPRLWSAELRSILAAGASYGRNASGAGKSVNVEYVSANPTGPLHAAHARGAVLGDALAGLLEFSGWNVTREYYTNDAGGQVDTLARSVYLRYREALGEVISEIPSGLYPGAYLKDVGAALAARDGDRYLAQEESEWIAPVRHFAIDAMMVMIREDLAGLGIEMDVFSSERALLADEIPVVLGGDFNVIPQDIDCYDPPGWVGDALTRIESRAAFFKICYSGYIDALRALHPSGVHYTYWDYQAGAWQRDNGVRIDHLLLSPEAGDRLVGVGIDKDQRGLERPSDHTPIWCELATPEIVNG